MADDTQRRVAEQLRRAQDAAKMDQQKRDAQNKRVADKIKNKNK